MDEPKRGPDWQWIGARATLPEAMTLAQEVCDYYRKYCDENQ